LFTHSGGVRSFFCDEIIQQFWRYRPMTATFNHDDFRGVAVELSGEIERRVRAGEYIFFPDNKSGRNLAVGFCVELSHQGTAGFLQMQNFTIGRTVSGIFNAGAFEVFVDF